MADKVEVGFCQNPGFGSYWYAQKLNGEVITRANTREELLPQLTEFDTVDIDSIIDVVDEEVEDELEYDEAFEDVLGNE